ncbi:hypothetical protein B0O99DRAFT_588434 [Bisporella sp. PMI_857]|nr:hypothetical protein B0O99DRAFT_588434 [Bisporella sp. PMI_857]
MSNRLDQENQTPTSPKQHKFSDSRSSLSSFTSSLHSTSHSTSHSRFSSMSTINSNSDQDLNTVPTDEAPTITKSALKSLDLAVISPKDNSPSTIPSPAGSLDALALAEHHTFAPQLLPQDTNGSTQTIPEDNEKSSISSQYTSQGRPSSPSDAILIKRTAVPILRVDTAVPILRADTADARFHGASQHNSNSYLSAPPLHDYQHQSGRKSHKRSVSAPNFPRFGISAGRDPIDFNAHSATTEYSTSMARTLDAHYDTKHLDFNRNLHVVAEPTPPSSHHPDIASPSPLTYHPPDTPPRASAEPEPQTATCMYIPNCDTESQLRKAISHIFGRNKMCTRLIPQLVWVHYCRKHYQRSRYRNPKEYAKLQCNLVQEQIRRIHNWSETNAANGEPGVVQDWGLSVRKREAKRLEDAKNKKRRAATLDHDVSDDESRSTDFVPPTAVPQWLLDSCGKGYTTQQILEIFNRLHAAVLQDLIPQFPDIEILPNIVTDQDVPKSPKGYTKRDQQPFHSHRRSQSLGVSISSSRRASQSSWSAEDLTYGFPAQKRHRINGWVEDSIAEQFQPAFARNDRQIEAGRRVQQLPHRPVFANIEENQIIEEPSNGYVLKDPSYGNSGKSYEQPLLKAPVPQRYNGQSMAVHLERSNEELRTAKRPAHHRSQSDMGFPRGRATYSPSPIIYTTDQTFQNNSFLPQAQPRTMSYTPFQFRQEQSTPAILSNPHVVTNRHHRHQSTPMIQVQPAIYGREIPPSEPFYQFSYPQTRINPIAEVGHARDY